MRAPLPCPLGCVEDVSKPCGIHHNIDCCRDHHTVVPPKPRRLPPLPANIDSDPAEDYIAELTEQLRKSQAELARYRAVVDAQDAYIEFLDNYLVGVSSYLNVHGQGAQSSDVNQGAEHRRQIADALAALEDR